MSDYSDIFLAMGLSAAILEKAEKQSKIKKPIHNSTKQYATV